MGNCQDSSCDKPITLTSEPTFAALSGKSVRTVLSVPKMDSPTEEAMIRGKLGGMPGIDGLECNLMQRWLTLTHRPEALEPALRAINALGLGAAVVGASAPGEDRAQGWSMPHWKWGCWVWRRSRPSPLRSSTLPDRVAVGWSSPWPFWQSRLAQSPVRGKGAARVARPSRMATIDNTLVAFRKAACQRIAIRRGINGRTLLAIGAALAFSLSVRVSKLLLSQTSQFAVVGLLYLGAGLALTVHGLASRKSQDAEEGTDRPRWAGKDWW
jgi:hypothetical protein